jgi:hypothetical protein
MPHAELTGDEYRISVMMMPAGQNTPGNWELDLRGNGDYHVNERYPIAVELNVTHGTMAKTSLRGTDAAEYTQQRARFAQAVTSAGRGTLIRGTVRFGMCRAEQCGFFTREFTVGMP